MPFDIGFFELCVIAIIGLLVLGPERLPVAARAVGRWVGKARRTFTSFKSEIDRELQIDELRRQLNEQQAKMDQFMNQRPLDDLLNETPEELQSKIDQTRQDFDQQRQQQETAASEQNTEHADDNAEPSTNGTAENSSAEQVEIDEFSGCDNPVEYEPIPRSDDAPTIHPPEPKQDPKSSAPNSDEKA